MAISPASILIDAILLLVQVLLSLPWLTLAVQLDPRRLAGKNDRAQLGRLLVPVLVIVGACLVLPVLYGIFVSDRTSLEISGRSYGAIFQLQLTIDLFIGLFYLVLLVWPKGGAVALAAFQEGVRQWMFWLLVGLAVLLMTVSVFVPYFTFGEDYLMVKQLGYDTIMLFAVLFGTLAASLSISEEIEGRTAVTLMSKPVSRRQFLLGKYLGILLAAAFMFGILAVYFEGVLFAKHWVEKLNPINEVAESKIIQETNQIGVMPAPTWVLDAIKACNLPATTSDFLRGVAQWATHALDTLPGLVLCFSHVLVLVALAVALATRVPMVVNLVTVLVVYVAAHLTPALLSVATRASATNPSSPARLVGFVAGVFDTILPNLSSFRLDPALLSDAPPPPLEFAQYVGAVTVYGLVYTVIVLLFGLILFEDKDLA